MPILYSLLFFSLVTFMFIWKINLYESDLVKLQKLIAKEVLHKRPILKNLQPIFLSKYLNKTFLPMIYAITPTYQRYYQIAELTRLAQTLSLIPNLRWILVEDSKEKSNLVANFLNDSDLLYTHLAVKTPKPQHPLHFHKGRDQRNAGIRWLRENLRKQEDKGVVYFMDDDNTYSVKIFQEIAKVKRVGVWPVGLVGHYYVERPIVSKKTGKVINFQASNIDHRKFATDMAGFAVNLGEILDNPTLEFSFFAYNGYMENSFIGELLFSLKDLEPLADNCSKVYVWHTQVKRHKIRHLVPRIQV